MLVRLIMLAFVGLMMLPEPASAADSIWCASQSPVTRRCFFSLYKPCIKKGLGEKFCHQRASACRTCSANIFKCWKTLKHNDRCGTCGVPYDKCLEPLFKGVDNFN